MVGGTPSSHDGGGGLPHPVMVGEYPIQLWWEGGYPIQSCGGYLRYPPPSRPGQGYPGYSPTIQTWDGVPPHHPDLGWGTPSPSRPGMGYPPTIQTWDGVPPPPTIPPSRPGTGYPPPPTNGEQTFQSINITFPRTTYAGGKKPETPCHKSSVKKW